LGASETVPRTCDQTINDRVQIDFRVRHKDFAGARTGFGESGAGTVTFGNGVGTGESTEIERWRKREKKEDEGSGVEREKGNIDPRRSSRWGFFVIASCHCHLPLPLPAVEQVKDRNKNKKRDSACSFLPIFSFFSFGPRRSL
jgi:hypothetical protein